MKTKDDEIIEVEYFKARVIKTKKGRWYKLGDIIELKHGIFYYKDKPHFESVESKYGKQGIPVHHCRILNYSESIPGYTMNQLINKIGHEFKIIK